MANSCQSSSELRINARKKYHINQRAVNRNQVQRNKNCSFNEIVFRQINLGRRKLAMIDLAQKNDWILIEQKIVEEDPLDVIAENILKATQEKLG